MNSPVVVTIQKVNCLTCDDWVIELPLLNLEVDMVRRWSANSLYVLQLDSGLNCGHVAFSLNALEEINRQWDFCVSNNIKFKNVSL